MVVIYFLRCKCYTLALKLEPDTSRNYYWQGIILRTPLHWPLNRGFTFSCWLRVEAFPRFGAMGLFSFVTENGKGCFSLIAKDKIIYEVHCKYFVTVFIHVLYIFRGSFPYIFCESFGFLWIVNAIDLIFLGLLQSINQKHHGISLQVSLVKKKWHYLCITHSIGRAFSGGSLLKCYLDGNIVSSERCRCALSLFFVLLLFFRVFTKEVEFVKE